MSDKTIEMYLRSPHIKDREEPVGHVQHIEVTDLGSFIYCTRMMVNLNRVDIDDMRNGNISFDFKNNMHGGSMSYINCRWVWKECGQITTATDSIVVIEGAVFSCELKTELNCDEEDNC